MSRVEQIERPYGLHLKNLQCLHLINEVTFQLHSMETHSLPYIHGSSKSQIEISEENDLNYIQIFSCVPQIHS